jgi:hypothetical protein
LSNLKLVAKNVLNFQEGREGRGVVK